MEANGYVLALTEFHRYLWISVGLSIIGTIQALITNRY